MRLSIAILSSLVLSGCDNEQESRPKPVVAPVSITVGDLEREFAERIAGTHRAYAVHIPDDPPYAHQISTDPSGEVTISVNNGKIVDATVKNPAGWTMTLAPERREVRTVKEIGLNKAVLGLDSDPVFLSIESFDEHKFILWWENVSDAPPHGEAWLIEVIDPSKLPK